MRAKDIFETVLFIAVFTLAGCATDPISKNLRLQAQKDLTYAKAAKDPDSHKGALVIWGGYIAATANHQNYSKVTVIDTPVDGSHEPDDIKTADGRFMALINKYLDPAVYRKNRKVTIAGKITGTETGKIGKLNYTYLVLDADEFYMWPRETPAYPYDPMFEYNYWQSPGYMYGPGWNDPAWYGPAPYGPDWYGPGWYGPREFHEEHEEEEEHERHGGHERH